MPRFSPVTKAERIEASPQIDGRIAVRELHVADSGYSEERSYLANENVDLDALLEMHADLFLRKLAGL